MQDFFGKFLALGDNFLPFRGSLSWSTHSDKLKLTSQVRNQKKKYAGWMAMTLGVAFALHLEFLSALLYYIWRIVNSSR